MAAIAILWDGMEGLLYQPLVDFLAACEVDELRLSFEDIERIIGRPLPRSASRAGWWANWDVTAQGRAWCGAGWRCSGRYVRTGLVIFTQQRSDHP